MSIKQRLQKIERRLRGSHYDEGNPFTWPAAWEAYGVLLERGYKMMKHAAALYEHGRIDDLKELWVKLASLNPSRTQPNEDQLSWAVDRMPFMLGKWKQEDWWHDE